MKETLKEEFFQILLKKNSDKKTRSKNQILESFRKCNPIDNADPVSQITQIFILLSDLANEKLITLPKSKELWDFSTNPALPFKINITISEKSAFSSSRELRSYSWNPKLQHLSRLPVKINKKAFELLIKINFYFKHNNMDKIPYLSVNERSYLIFNHEKTLDKLYGREWFKNAFNYDLLRCYKTQEPFASITFPNAIELKGIILENRDTFNSFIKVNRSLKIPHYLYIIYGNGFEIINTIKWISQFDPTPEIIEYFGDIDEDGFQIPFYTKEKLDTLDLNVDFQLNELYYEYIIDKIKGENLIITNKKGFRNVLKENYFLNLSERTKKYFLDIMKSNKYIPQEILTFSDISKILENNY